MIQADRADASAAVPPCPFCAAAAARAARGCILLDAVPVCRACFLRDGHTTMTVQHIDGELQLKAHTLALATLRVAAAEGARWCAPRLSVYECRRCSLHVPDPRAPLCAHALFVRLFAVCVDQPGHERGAMIGLTDGRTDRSVRCGAAINASTWDTQPGTRSTRSRGFRRG